MKTVPHENLEGLVPAQVEKMDPKAKKAVEDAAKKWEEDLMGTIEK